MSKAVKERKYLKRHTGNGIEVQRKFKQIDNKVEAQRKAEGVFAYNLRQQMAKRQLSVNYGKLYE